MRTAYLAATAIATAALTGVFATTTASANAEKYDGPVSLTVTGEGLVVGKTVTTYASSGGEGQVQAYYVIVGPNGGVDKVNSERVQTGATGSGLYRDSYGPIGGFLDGTKICAGWLDPTGRVSIPGYPCVTIHK